MAITETVFSDGTVPAMQYSQFRLQAQDGDIMLCSCSRG
jgi:hypothetical protein